MSHLAQILFLFYIFIFALNQERKTVSGKEYAYDIIYINLKCPDNIIKLLVAVFLKALIFGHFPPMPTTNVQFPAIYLASIFACVTWATSMWGEFIPKCACLKPLEVNISTKTRAPNRECSCAWLWFDYGTWLYFLSHKVSP